MLSIQPISAAETWPLRHEVMWPDEPIDFVKLAGDETDGQHYGLFIDEELISVVSLFAAPDASAQFRKFATLLVHQGKGYGTQLLRFLINECRSQGIKRLWCNARANKTEFYERFGLQKTAETFHKRGHDFVVMEVFLVN